MGAHKEKDNGGVVVVTGASRGVGRETVIALVGMGRSVVAVARNEDALNALVAACSNGPGTLRTLVVDLEDEAAGVSIKDALVGKRVIALVHNAGLLNNTSMGLHSRKDLEQLYRVNVFAPLELSQALAEELSGDPPGHIVHIGSMGGFQDSSKFPGLVAYSASKAALACIAQCLAEEFKDKGIRSNCLALGSVDTAMLRAAFPGFKSTTTAEQMGRYVAEFSLHGHKLFNGKVLPVAVTTP